MNWMKIRFYAVFRPTDGWIDRVGEAQWRVEWSYFVNEISSLLRPPRVQVKLIKKEARARIELRWKQWSTSRSRKKERETERAMNWLVVFWLPVHIDDYSPPPPPPQRLRRRRRRRSRVSFKWKENVSTTEWTLRKKWECGRRADGRAGGQECVSVVLWNDWNSHWVRPFVRPSCASMKRNHLRDQCLSLNLFTF